MPGILLVTYPTGTESTHTRAIYRKIIGQPVDRRNTGQKPLILVFEPLA
jgi:hypothetical protein